MTRDDDRRDAAPPAAPLTLSRWSQRKRETLRERGEAAADAAGATDPVADAATVAAPASTAAAADAERAQLTDEDMPPLDQLDERSDVSGFFSPKVSAELRRLALRKLFHLPAYNLRDGLNDYDDDYTQFESLGNIVTADMRHREEMKRLLAQQDADQANAASTDEESTAAASTDHEPVDGEPTDNGSTDAAPADAEAAAAARDQPATPPPAETELRRPDTPEADADASGRPT